MTEEDPETLRARLRTLCEKAIAQRSDNARADLIAALSPECVLALIDAHEADLKDMGFVVDQVSRVYEHVTGGLLSKPLYYATTVIAVADDHITKLFEEQLQEERALEQGQPPSIATLGRQLAQTAACEQALRRRCTRIKDELELAADGRASAADTLATIAHLLEVLPDAPKPAQPDPAAPA